MEQLGRYLLDKKLAQGGMAEVFLARQIGPGGQQKTCVVKRMLPHLSEDVTFIEMFLDEARLAARLAHPGIAQILDFGHERDTYYLALEYVNGQNLKTVLEHRLEKKKPIPLPVAARLTAIVAIALDYAHHAIDEKGRPLDLIHRDVSPQNVMVGANGEVKLIDFGIAKAATDSHRTVAGVLKGKYAYMSPEQLRTSKVDQRTDIYALGLVLYEMITGHPAVPPNENMNALLMAAAQRKYAPVDQYRPETPKALRQILDRALAVEPADRFPKARDMAEALEGWLTATGLRVKPADLAALVTDPALITTDPAARQAAPIALRDEVPQATMVTEPETLRDMPRPKELQNSKALQALRETIASRRGSDRQPALAPPVPDPPVYDPSMEPTPVVGTPAVARRAVGPATDTSLLPTDPIKSAPDIAAAMARPPKKPSYELVAVTQPSMPNPMMVPQPAASPMPEPLKTTEQPMVLPTAVTAGPQFPRRARRWPWVLLILVLLPIGGVAGAIEFLPKESAVRARLIDVVAPLLAKLKK